MSLMSGIGLNTFTDYGGDPGNAGEVQVNRALQIAWERIESAIGTNLYPYVETDEYHTWPANGILKLDKTYVSSVTSITSKHDEGSCSCDVVDFTACAILLDSKLGQISVRECYGSGSGCANCSCSQHGHGKWLVVSYQAGISQPLDESLKLAIVLLAKDILPVLTTTTSDDINHLKQIQSWSSLGYSESYAPKNTNNRFSTPTRADLIADLIRPYRKKPALSLGNPRPSRIV